jgi:DNA-binding IclR family transcriptional regulator
VVNAIAILRYLASAPPQGVNAIARAVSLNPSSCFNLLKTLTEEALLEFDPQTKTYRRGLGPSWLMLPQFDLLGWTQWLRTEMQRISVESCITSGLWQVTGDRLILAEVADSPLDTRIHLAVGQRLPSHIGAIGRCVAAHERRSLEEVAGIIAELRWQVPPAPEAYWRDMQLALERGWAVDEGNYLHGVTTIASAIPNPLGPIRYCITSTMFSGQYDKPVLLQLGNRIAALAREAGRRLERPPRRTAPRLRRQLEIPH